MDLVCKVRSGDVLGEGPVWHAADRRLYWFDIKGRRLCWFAPHEDSHGEWPMPVQVSAAAPWGPGRMVAIGESGLGRIDTASGAFEVLVPLALPEGFRSNEGLIDVKGRFWWSTMDDDGGKRPGDIYRTDADGRSHRLLRGIHIANTLASDPAGERLYLADSLLQTMFAFDMDEAGGISGRREFFNMTGQAGGPDGSAVDAEGGLWNAQWGAWRIVRYRPDGTVDRIVEVPVQQPTSLAFGGPDLDVLYVTSAQEHLTPAALAEQPLAGALLAFTPGVRGLALPDFTAGALVGGVEIGD